MNINEIQFSGEDVLATLLPTRTSLNPISPLSVSAYRFIKINKFTGAKIVWTEAQKGARTNLGLPMLALEAEEFNAMLKHGRWFVATVANAYIIEENK